VDFFNYNPQANASTLAVDAYLVSLVKRFPTATRVFFGTEAGHFASAERDEHGNFLIGAKDATTGNVYDKYNVSATGQRAGRAAIPGYPDTDFLVKPRPWYAAATKSRASHGASLVGWIDVYTFSDTKVGITGILPYFHKSSDDEPAGVFAVDFDLHYISASLSTLVPKDIKSRAFIVDRDGMLISAAKSAVPLEVDGPNQSRSCLMPNSIPADAASIIQAEATTLMGWAPFSDFLKARTYGVLVM
jgi:hypothetical protein